MESFFGGPLRVKHGVFETVINEVVAVLSVVKTFFSLPFHQAFEAENNRILRHYGHVPYFDRFADISFTNDAVGRRAKQLLECLKFLLVFISQLVSLGGVFLLALI